MLLIAAGADQVRPSAQMARSLSARLRQHGDPHGHTLLDYPRAGHSLGYLIPRLPPGLLPRGITDQPADQAARASAWPGPSSSSAACRSRRKPVLPGRPLTQPWQRTRHPVIQPGTRPETLVTADMSKPRATATVNGHYAT